MDIKFHLPDFVRHFRLNLTLAEYMSRFPDAFVDGVKIGSVYGCFPNMTWNGGRFIQELSVRYSASSTSVAFPAVLLSQTPK